MPKQDKIQRSFIATIAAGVSLSDALEIHRLGWGTIAAWRRWTPGFRTAHNRAQKTGLPKRRLIRLADQLQTRYGGRLILAPDLAQALENCTRARVRAARGCALLRPLE